MYRRIGLILAILLSNLFVAQNALAVGAPNIIFHGGKISVNDRPFTGKGFFKFAIINLHSSCDNSTAGCMSLWSNDLSSSTGEEPARKLAIDVNNGIYSVQLGDTNIINYETNIAMEPIPSSAFTEENTFLRVWFSDNGTDRWQQLKPDRQLLSVPYAIRAQTASDSSGVDQTWVDVLPDRQAGTIYPNNTARPITVNVCVRSSGSNVWAYLNVIDPVGNSVRVSSAGLTTSTVHASSVSALVPSGHSYEFTVGASNIECWSELK